MGKEVAQEILRQLGGRRFVVMTGAKDFISDGNKLIMTLPRNHSKSNRLEIALNGNDLYDMRFYRRTGGTFDEKKLEIRPIKETEDKVYNDVFFDQLQDIFTQHTWMYTHF